MAVYGQFAVATDSPGIRDTKHVFPYVDMEVGDLEAAKQTFLSSAVPDGTQPGHALRGRSDWPCDVST